MRRDLARGILQLSGLPSLDSVESEARLDPVLHDVAGRLQAGDAAAIDDSPIPRTEFLRWLAQHRNVLFHGSGRDDIRVLEPIRLSSDTTAFGNQQAVYATDDPVWAIYFATLRRHAPFGTRNGSIAVAGADLYPRWYHFSVTAPLDRQTRFGPGWLYVLPRDSFTPQPAVLGVLDTAQWVSPVSVEPVVRIPVTPEDFRSSTT